MGAPIKLLLEKKIQPLDDKINCNNFFFNVFTQYKIQNNFYWEEHLVLITTRGLKPGKGN